MVSLIKLDFSFEILKEKSLFLVNLAYFRKEEKKKTPEKKTTIKSKAPSGHYGPLLQNWD